MSASREKKKRQEQLNTEAVQPQETKKGLGKGAKTALTAVVAVVLAAVIVFFALVGVGFFEKHTTAAVANGHKLTPAMVNIYYSNAYSNMSSMLSYVIDTSLPLDEQAYATDDFETWADYMMDYAVSTAAQTYAIYDEAVANGFTLTEASQTAIDTELNNMDAIATMYGYGSGDALLAAQFGTGTDMDTYEEFLKVNYLAQDYSNSIVESLTYTQDEMDAYYAENSTEFDGVSFRLYTINAEVAEDAEEPTEEALAAAEETAKAMAEASQGDEQVFMDLCVENAPEDAKSAYEDNSDTTLREDYSIDNCGEAYREWISDPARQPGDTTYVANGTTGYQVVYFIENVDHSYLLPNVRHILISVSDVTDAEAMADAKTQAESILNEFLAGEQTEEAFAALADDRSADSPEGGLYEEIAPGAMVDTFNDWCFDESRQPGDTGIVESSYGYHVMYFSGLSETTYHNYLVENAMLNEDYSTWQSEVMADMAYTVKSAKFVETR